MFGTADELLFLFGDSITEQGYSQKLGFGWVAQLADDYRRKLTVVNAGLSGYSTDKALSKLPLIIPPPDQAKIRIFAVFFGANDARLPNTMQAPQHVPLPEFKENLKKIVMHPAVYAHKAEILLITPPPIDERMCEAHDLSMGINQVRRSAKVTRQYAEAVLDVSRELGVECLDLWSAFMERVGWLSTDPLLPGCKETNAGKDDLSLLLLDGLHLTAEGNRLVYTEFSRLVKDVWPELLPESMLFSLPYWADTEAWKDLWSSST
jgi:lysophospholipase L1-like esterase